MGTTTVKKAAAKKSAKTKEKTPAKKARFDLHHALQEYFGLNKIKKNKIVIA